MRRILIVVTVLVLLTAGYGAYLYVAAGQLRDVPRAFAGSCTRIEGVAGPEDVEFLPLSAGPGLAVISSDDRRAAARGSPVPGALYLYDTATGRLKNLTPGASNAFHPHGLSVTRGRDGGLYIFVVNHPWRGEGARQGHEIAVFRFEPGKPLRRIRTIRDQAISAPNDVFALDDRRFYVTNDHGLSGILRKLEDYGRLPASNLVYADGLTLRVAAEGFRYASGVWVNDKGDRLFVAAAIDRAVFVFDWDPQTGMLSNRRRMEMDMGADNLNGDESGAVWVAGHPKLLSFVAHASDAGNKAPSEVYRLTADGQGGYRKERIFSDDGSLFSASSAAAVQGRRMLLGTPFDDGFLDCRLP